MLFSMKTEYALRALFELSGQEKNIPLKRQEISKRQSIPIHFLEQILIELKKSGLITSIKGPGGGYILNKEIQDLNLWDIYRSVDYKEYEGTKCFPGLSQECEHLKLCQIKKTWFSINQAIQHTLSQMTMKTILGDL